MGEGACALLFLLSYVSAVFDPYFLAEMFDTGKADGWYDYDDSGAMVVEQLYTE